MVKRILLSLAAGLLAAGIAAMGWNLAQVGQQREGLTLQQAEEKLQREDRRRREHYRYYTHGIWGLASNYHLTMDTGLGLAFARQGILAALKEKQAQKEST